MVANAVGANAGEVELDEAESRRLLRIISQTRTIGRHLQLFQMLQGDVQYFLPHQILISAWGNLRGADVKFDIASALPGLRTDRFIGGNVSRLLGDLYARWLDHGRQPLLIEIAGLKRLAQQESSCELRKFLRDMKALLVHGTHSARDGADTLYLAASPLPMASSANQERFLRIADLVIAQIDVAYRRVSELRLPAMPSSRASSVPSGGLTPRESEIIHWVAQGRTNADIACILAISAFTVKNHVQRIIRKLGAANRTEAAAIYRLGAPLAKEPRRIDRGASAAPHAADAQAPRVQP